MKLGKLSPFTCPECSGILLQIEEGGNVRFRCHTGHAYSVNSLLDDVTDSVEHNLWSAVRVMDELVLLLRHLDQHSQAQSNTAASARIAEQIGDVQRRTRLIREALLQPKPPLAP